MLHKLKNFPAQVSDAIGVSASFLCIVHCLALPVLMSFGIFVQIGSNGPRHFGLKYQHAHFGWHRLDVLFVAIALWAVYVTVKNTHSLLIKIGLWCSLTVFSFATLLHDKFYGMYFVSFAASMMLIIFHILNWKYYKNINNGKK